MFTVCQYCSTNTHFLFKETENSMKYRNIT